MNTTKAELIKFWNELKSKAEIKFKDIEHLEKLLGNAVQRISDLEESRDRWRAKALEIKK
jgi:hypothetical protein